MDSTTVGKPLRVETRWVENVSPPIRNFKSRLEASLAPRSCEEPGSEVEPEPAMMASTGRTP